MHATSDVIGRRLTKIDVGLTVPTHLEAQLAIAEAELWRNPFWNLVVTSPSRFAVLFARLDLVVVDDSLHRHHGPALVFTR